MRSRAKCACLPVTVFCPSVRLLQKSSAMDMSRMSCRWKPDSRFHQSCQQAMSWEPWSHSAVSISQLTVTDRDATPVIAAPPHLQQLLRIFFFRRLDFGLQGLVLQDGCSAKGAACKLTWSQLTTTAIPTQYQNTHSLDCLSYECRMLGRTPTVNTSGLSSDGLEALRGGTEPP